MDSDLRCLVRALPLLSSEEQQSLFQQTGFSIFPTKNLRLLAKTILQLSACTACHGKGTLLSCQERHVHGFSYHSQLGKVVELCNKKVKVKCCCNNGYPSINNEIRQLCLQVLGKKKL